MTCLLVLLQAGCQPPRLQIWVQAPPCSLLSTAWVPGQLRLLLALEEPWEPCWCHLHPPLFASVTYTLHFPCLRTGSWPEGYP